MSQSRVRVSRPWTVRTRLVVFASAVTLVVGACSSSGSTSSKSGTPSGKAASVGTLTVGDYAGAINDIPDLVGIAQGFYQDNGLTVNMIPVTNGPAQAAAVQSGSIDIESNTPDNVMLTMTKGEQEITLVNYIKGVFYAIQVQTSWPTPHAKDGFPAVMQDLKSAKIGVTAPGSSENLVTAQLLRDAGLSPSDVTFIGVGSVTTALAAWQHHQIDANVSVEPEITLLAPTAKTLFDIRSGKAPGFTDWPGQLRATMKSNVDAHPAAYEAYIKGFVQAVNFMKDPANTAKVVEDISQSVHLPTATLTSIVNSNRQYWSTSISCPGWQQVGAYLVAAGLIKANQTPNCSSAIWPKASALWGGS